MATQKPRPQLWFQTKNSDSYYWYLGESPSEINESFSRLFQQYPLKSLITIGDPQDGLLDAEILPPTILTPDSNSLIGLSELLLQLRFKDGAIVSTDTEEIISIFGGWVITVPIKLEKSKVEITASMSREDSYAALEKNSSTDSPDNQDTESVYLRLSSIEWESFNDDHTHCGLDDNEQPISLHDWARNNKRWYDTLIRFLRKWALDGMQ